MAIVDYFLKIEGIAGESTDVQHKDEHEVKAFSFGIENPTTIGSATGGAGAGKVRFNEFTIKKTSDKASPTFFKNCCTGAHYKTAVLTVRKAGGDKGGDDFLKVRFSDVLISSYRESAQASTPSQPPSGVASANLDVIAAPGGDPEDSIGLRYTKIEAVSGTPQRINVPPTAGGTLTFNPKTKQVTVGDLNGDGIMIVGTIGGNIMRAVQEFDVKILIGLLTAPFSTARLGLHVQQVRQPALNAASASPAAQTTAALHPDPPGADRDNEDDNRDRDDKPKPRPVRFDVLLYRDADGVINAADLRRPGNRIGQLLVDPSGLASLDIDLGPILLKHHTDTFGVRLQLHGAGIPEPLENAEDNERDEDERDGDDHDKEHHDEGGGARPDASASFTMSLVFDTAT